MHDDAPAFAAGVIDVLRDSPLRQRLGTAARELAERYDWSRVIGDFEQALARTMQARAAQSPSLS